FGTPTGKAAIMAKGESLPHAPRGFTWRPLSERSPADLRAGAAGYRRMAGTARTATVAESLQTGSKHWRISRDKRPKSAAAGHDSCFAAALAPPHTRAVVSLVGLARK